MKTTYKSLILLTCSLVLATLSGCGGGAAIPKAKDNCDGPPLGKPLVDVHKVPDAVPKHEPLSRIGNKSTYTVFQQQYKVMPHNKGFRQKGPASWYGRKWHGRKTANGETYDMYAMTAAHKHLPLPTYLKVTNLQNGKKVVVRVNDRGPFVGKRIIDLSYAAAARLGLVGSGIGLVEIEAVHPPLRFAENQAESRPPQNKIPIKRTVIEMRKGAPNIVTKRPPSDPRFIPKV